MRFFVFLLALLSAGFIFLVHLFFAVISINGGWSGNALVTGQTYMTAAGVVLLAACPLGFVVVFWIAAARSALVASTVKLGFYLACAVMLIVGAVHGLSDPGDFFWLGLPVVLTGASLAVLVSWET